MLPALSAKAQGIFSYTGTIDSYTFTSTGLYNIDVFGADGGSGVGVDGGLGTLISGQFEFTAGTTLQIVVGGAGSSGDFGDLWAGGGGGGTFVYVAGDANPLLVGGGGGGSSYAFDNGGNCQTGTAGDNGHGPSGGVGGTNGSGGEGGIYGNFDGGGGGGWLGNGTDAIEGAGQYAGAGGIGAFSFAGGAGGTDGFGNFANGGFGGGGGGGFQGGGGGGGYSGGGGGDGFTNGGGGGGSYAAAIAHNVTFGTNGHGNGSVMIILAPESSSLVLTLSALGVCGAGFLVRRRKAAQ